MRKEELTLALSCLVLSACSSDSVRQLSTHEITSSKSDTFNFTWALPKTIFSVDATVQLTGCDGRTDTAKVPQLNLDLQVDAGITATAVADPAVKWVRLNVSQMDSLLQDHALTVTTAESTHVLQGLNSTATDETGTIVGNFFGLVGKIADIRAAKLAKSREGFPRPSNSPQCGPAVQDVKRLPAKEEQLAALTDQTTDKAKQLIAEIGLLKQELVIKLPTENIDPGFDSKSHRPTPIVDGYVGQISIPNETLLRKGWVVIPTFATPPQMVLSIRMDFAKALPRDLRQCTSTPSGPGGTPLSKPAPCSPAASPLLRNGLFREVAYIPVDVLGMDDSVIATKTLPFAQFGASRTLPINAHFFAKSDWSLVFNPFGEVTSAHWGTQATGVGASKLLLDIGGAASTVATDKTKAPPTDRHTLELQAENTQLQAIMDNATKKQQCLAMKAKGQVKDCP